MKIKLIAFISALFILCISCESNSKIKKTDSVNNLIMDRHTLSNYKDLPIVNTHLELSVNFQERKLKGSVTHEFEANRKNNLLKLDTKYLKIDSIQDGDGNTLEYSLG